MRILYIEDNPNDAKLVKRYVDTTPHELVVTQSLEQTYELLSSSQSFDLVLVDILINNQRSGYELPNRLHEQGYTNNIIAVTGLTSAQDTAACKKAGFAAILAKPFLITTLADMIAQYSNVA